MIIDLVLLLKTVQGVVYCWIISAQSGQNMGVHSIGVLFYCKKVCFVLLKMVC